MDFSKLTDERNGLMDLNDKVIGKGVEFGKLEDADKAEYASRTERIKEIDDLISKAKAHAEAKFKKDEVNKGTDFDNKPVNVPSDLEKFNRYLMTGDRSEFSLTSTIPGNTVGGTTGTVPIPVELLKPLVARRAGNVIRQALADAGYAPIYNSQAVSYNLPLFDDTANNGEDLLEGATGSRVDPSVTTATLQALLKNSKQTWLSNTSILGNGDIQSLILPALYKRLDHLQEGEYIAKMKAAAPVGYTVTSGAFSYINYMTWLYSVSPLYRDDAIVFVSDYGSQLLSEVVDTTGRPILNTDVSTGITKLGSRKVYTVASLDGAGSAHTIAILANPEALKVYDAGPDRVKVYTDNPAAGYEDMTGYQIFRNGDFYAASFGLSKLVTA